MPIEDEPEAAPDGNMATLAPTAPTFTALPLAKRRAMTETALRDGVTLMARWASLPTENKEGWRPRAAIAAEMVAGTGAASVLDLGCGHMYLEALLPKGIHYLPSDVIRRDKRTLVCDLNREAPPMVEADAVACLGLLEYMLDPAALLGRLARQHRFAVISYVPLSPVRSVAKRRSQFWFSDLSAEALRALFGTTGWTIREERPLGPEQLIWSLGQTAPPGG
jgi:hypothetical protein